MADRKAYRQCPGENILSNGQFPSSKRVLRCYFMAFSEGRSLATSIGLFVRVCHSKNVFGASFADFRKVKNEY